MFFLFFFLLLLNLDELAGHEIQMGTTIVAARYRDGVVIGADSRTSVSGYVSNRFASKLTFILNNNNNNGSTCCMARSGSAADTQQLCFVIQQELSTRELLQGIQGTVTNAAYLARCYLREHPEWSCGILCAGYDHVDQCGKIYSISPGGAIMEEEELALGGSGSTYILGHVDNTNMQPSTMTEEECIEFVGHAIELAMNRDGSSGGHVSIHVIDRRGSKTMVRIPTTKNNNTPKSQYQSSSNNSTLSLFASPKRRISF